jgi:hypothetical protein
MTDLLKHSDTHGEEIQNLVSGVIDDHLADTVLKSGYCPKCVALTLLEFAAFAATSAGATVAEVLGAAAGGAETAEDELELGEAQPPTTARH